MRSEKKQKRSKIKQADNRSSLDQQYPNYRYLQVNQTISAARRYQKNANQKSLSNDKDFTKLINASINASNHQHKNMFNRKLRKAEANQIQNNKKRSRKPKQFNIGSARYEHSLSRHSSKSPYFNIISERQSQLSRQKNNQKNRIQFSLSKKLSPHHFTILPKSNLENYQSIDVRQREFNNRRRVSVLQHPKISSIDSIKNMYKNHEYEQCINALKKKALSPQNLYYLGMSYINVNQYTLGIDRLLQCVRLQPNFKRSLYLALALAFKKLERMQDAVNILTRCLKYFPDYYDGLIYRGKMYYKEGLFQKAKVDFQSAVKLDDQKGFGYVGKGNAQIQLEQFEQAILSFSKGIYTNSKLICYEKRALCFFEIKNYTQALKDIFLYEKVDKSKLWDYFKGICYYRLNQKQNALMALELCLQNDTNPQQVTYAAEIIMKIKITQKDFYQAHHVLSRVKNMSIIEEDIEYWKNFLDGALFLMKKKIKEGVQVLRKLLQQPLFQSFLHKVEDPKKIERYTFLKPLIYLFKAFGQLSLNNRKQARADYLQYENAISESGVKQQDVSKKYNTLLIQAYQAFPKACRQYIQQAKKLLPMKPQPYLLISLQIVNNKLQNLQFDYSKQWEKKNRQQIIQEILQNLQLAIQNLPQLSNNHISTFYYYRSIIHLHNNDFMKSVKDIDKAIQKSEDNIPKYFYLRGCIFGIFGNFPQAIQDYSVAINLDQNYNKPYLERAKCLQIQGNSNEAFVDLQKYITLAPQDPNIHKYAGIFLFQNCSYDDCLAAFKHGPAQKSSDLQTILTKAKCHFLLANYQTSLTLFDLYQNQSFSAEYLIDTIAIEVVSKIKQGVSQQQLLKLKWSLKKLQQSGGYKEGKIFKQQQMTHIRGSLDLLLGQYQSALSWFFQALQLLQQDKKKERQKSFIESQDQQFEQQWSQVQLKYNIVLSYLCLGMYEEAEQRKQQILKNSQKGKDWELFLRVVNWFNEKDFDAKQPMQLITFEQDHKISKHWPRLKIPGTQISISLCFSYPFVQPPQLIPQFDEDFWQEFQIFKVQIKPQAPWINRKNEGLVFTSDLQNFENLQISRTTSNMNENSERNKGNSQRQYTINESQQIIIQPDALKKKFKLDSATQIKLQKLMQKGKKDK